MTKISYPFWFVAIALIYICNLFLDIMDIDAAQYASISREMFHTKSFLHVFHRGQDYLDKPPFLFWLSSLSFWIFGISNFAYKLPALCVLVLGIYSAYRFTQRFYSEDVARLSALILASSQGYFLMSNDVRTDGLLSGFVMFSIWQCSEYINHKKWSSLILTSIGVAFGLMSKGPIALIIPGLAIGTHVLLTKNWRTILDYKWILFFIFIALLLGPMCYGLYTQFDLHPEKLVYGLQGPSGLRFFFWTQSFGRITGEIYWDNDTTFFYFFHTILWDFQPWILFFIPALLTSLYSVYARIKLTEYITLGGFILSFIALSLSHYKLPHYIFPLFSFASILTANFIVTQTDNLWFKRLIKIQKGSLLLLYIALMLALIWFFPSPYYIMSVPIILAFGIFIYLLKNLKDQIGSVIIPSLFTILVFNATLTYYFYPKLMKYQCSSDVGRIFSKTESAYFYQTYDYSLDFYAQKSVPEMQLQNLDDCPSGTLIYTGEIGKNEILSKYPSFRILEQLDNYSITRLKLEFLKASTRNKAAEKRYVLRKF